MSLAIDLSALSPCCTDHALESLHKSLADPIDSDALWHAHPNPWIAGTVETVTSEGRSRLDQLLNHLVTVLRQAFRVQKAFRPDPQEVGAALERLAGKTPRQYTVADWLALIDWLVLNYLPPDFAMTQAEYLNARAYMAGQIQAEAPNARPPSDIESLYPATLAGLTQAIHLTPQRRAMIDVAVGRTAQAITHVGEATRNRIKRVVLDHLEKTLLGAPDATPAKLEQALFDEFSILNRDWRRIAITETGNIAAESVVAGAKVGQRVRRFEAYEGACPFCKKINGMVFTVVDPAKPEKDGWTEVWAGKTNVGRSASPRKREGDELVDREPDEMWWPAAGLQHPNCRGGWTVLQDIKGGAQVVSDVNRLLAKYGIGGGSGS